MHIIRRHFLVCGRGPSCHPLHVQYHVDQVAPRAPGRWTTARPRKGTTRRQGRLGSCFPRGGEYDCTRVYWFVCRRRRITAGVGE